jgi:hypothetical protein
MQQTARALVTSLVLLLPLAAAAPAHAASWLAGPMLPLTPATPPQTATAPITVQIRNRGALVQQVRVGGRVYTLMPYNRLTLKAPQGTQAYAASTGSKHRKGDMLFAFTPDRNNDTVTLD